MALDPHAGHSKKGTKAKSPWAKAVATETHGRKHRFPQHKPAPGPIMNVKKPKVHHPQASLAKLKKQEIKDAQTNLNRDEKSEEKAEGQLMGLKLQNKAHEAEQKTDVAIKEEALENAESAVSKDRRIQHKDEEKALDAEMKVGVPEWCTCGTGIDLMQWYKKHVQDQTNVHSGQW